MINFQNTLIVGNRVYRLFKHLIITLQKLQQFGTQYNEIPRNYRGQNKTT